MARLGLDLFGRRLAATLATLALVLQVLVPSGFMAARTEGGATLVICTGHGPWQGPAGDHGQPTRAPSSDQGHACVFAGHGGVTVAAALALPARSTFAYVPLSTAALADLLPGRGLAAPPPPALGPPGLSA